MDGYGKLTPEHPAIFSGSLAVTGICPLPTLLPFYDISIATIIERFRQ